MPLPTLNVVDLLVDDDLTVTDDVAIGGLATVGGTLGVTGIATFTDDIIIGDGKTIGSASTVGAITIASDGDIALTGVVTANAGVVVDNFTLDGTTLALSSGEFVLDVASAINFNSDTGNFRFQDAAVDVGIIQIANSDFTIRSLVSDKDIIFQGNDGGSAITALTLDMSEAGRATFNDVVRIPTNLESNGNMNMLFVDGGNNAVGIGNNVAASMFGVRNCYK